MAKNKKAAKKPKTQSQEAAGQTDILLENRRTTVRFAGSDKFLAFDDADLKGVPQYYVIDFSNWGCRLRCIDSDCELPSERSVRSLKFIIRGQPSSIAGGKDAVPGRVTRVDKKKNEFSFVFNRPLRLERIEPFEKFFIEPKVETASDRRHIYRQQEKIAISDLQELHAATRENVNRQFQLKLLGFPAIGGLLLTGLLLNVETNSTQSQSVPDGLFKRFRSLFEWVGVRQSETDSLSQVATGVISVGIPLFCSIVAVLVFVMYTQKASRIRERTAFCMLLQRYIALGAFPPCYRGWHDAQLNMRQLERYGAEREVFNPPGPIRERIGISIKVPFTKDPFTFAGMVLFLLLPFLSLFLAAGSLVVNWESVGAVIGVIISAGILLLLSVYIRILAEELFVQLGNRSTRHMMVKYSELLKCVPPFNPRNTGPVRFMSLD